MARVFCRASKSTRAAQACRCVAWLEGACALKEVRAKRKEKLRARVEFAGRKYVLPASNQQSPARRGAKTRDQSSAGQSFRLTNGGPFFGVFLAPVLRTKIMPLAAALATPGPARALQLTRCQRVTSATPSNNACLNTACWRPQRRCETAMLNRLWSCVAVSVSRGSNSLRRPCRVNPKTCCFYLLGFCGPRRLCWRPKLAFLAVSC